MLYSIIMFRNTWCICSAYIWFIVVINSFEEFVSQFFHLLDSSGSCRALSLNLSIVIQLNVRTSEDRLPSWCSRFSGLSLRKKDETTFRAKTDIQQQQQQQHFVKRMITGSKNNYSREERRAAISLEDLSTAKLLLNCVCNYYMVCKSTYI